MSGEWSGSVSPVSLTARIQAALAGSAKTTRAITRRTHSQQRTKPKESPVKLTQMNKERSRPKEVTCSFEELLSKVPGSVSPSRPEQQAQAVFSQDFLEPEDSATSRDSFVHNTHPPLLRTMQTEVKRGKGGAADDYANTSLTTHDSSRADPDLDDRQLLETVSQHLGLTSEFHLISSANPLPATIVVKTAKGYQVYDLRKS